MRKVIYKEYVQKKEYQPNGVTIKRQYYDLEERGEAAFHQFGVDYEEFENGTGSYSTAIIELKDGTIKNVPVEHIRFLS